MKCIGKFLDFKVDRSAYGIEKSVIYEIVK